MALTVAQAAKEWEETKRILEDVKARHEAARDVLLEHFRASGKSEYRGRISYAHTTYLALDTAAVKAELADRIGAFQVRRDREQLSLLK